MRERMRWWFVAGISVVDVKQQLRHQALQSGRKAALLHAFAGEVRLHEELVRSHYWAVLALDEIDGAYAAGGQFSKRQDAAICEIIHGHY